MKSKWIQDLIKSIVNLDRQEEKPDEILERIDKLLRESMSGTDNEDLHDRIKKEINGNPS